MLFALTAVVVLIVGLRLDRATLGVPLEYEGDALLILPIAKSAIERGSHWQTERLGAPGTQELYDFPIIDHLQLACIWALGQLVDGDVVAASNLFYLLTYPLTVLTTMFVLRHFGLSRPFAGVGGLLYAFQPYHYLRGMSHLFLAAYFVIPLTVMVILWVCRGRLPFFRQDDSGRYRVAIRSGDTLAAVAIAVATASAGAYYAFFACALLVVAGLYAWIALGTWRAAASAGAVTAVTVLAAVANLSPAIAYQMRNGANTEVTARQPEEAEIYGLKLTHLFLPVASHHSRELAAVRSTYDSAIRPIQNENTTATLGLIVGAGTLALLALTVAPVQRVWLLRRSWPLGPLSALAIAAISLGTIGGFGTLYNQFIDPQIRGYNRISIYVAFFGVFAACYLFDRFFDTRLSWVREFRWPAAILVAAVGVWDQTDARWFGPSPATVEDERFQTPAGYFTDLARGVPTPETAARFHADADFFAGIERAIPGGMVFTLPYVPFPETPWPTHSRYQYNHARGFLHTQTVRWSYGAMKGRETDLWQRSASLAAPPDMLRRIVLRGFDGLFIDSRGYQADDAAALLTAVEKELGPDATKLVHPNHTQVFYDLRPYRDRLRANLGTSFDAEAERETDRVSILWLNGFHDFLPPGHENEHRWCGQSGLAIIVNPSDRPRTFRASMLFRTTTEDCADLKIEGDVWTDRLPVNKDNCTISKYTWVVPPGRHAVHFRCRMPRSYVPHESRRLAFFIAAFQMDEIADPPTDAELSRK
ncbi:Integral membrane protein [Fimbriiglobus ruber]|uniref:Integral membrane protein n=1 Tax=Fimbriiglobus ruber TaxID=1908690 RepID=A0A225D2S2_9BACT|nr:Integral membrane protein [Fimbriiglobus ruber]